ncbi:hypothetical protein, partial [Candidatus Blastococcus massiliensis]|uniref:hypothetical protein n=1 Tax=Candidatus Blastococcus massiliensis TaxID=1470358 RepID=UPI0005909701
MGDEPRADDARRRGVPDGSRHRPADGEALTVEQLLARSGSTAHRRRAARRESERPSAPAVPPPGVRDGLP